MDELRVLQQVTEALGTKPVAIERMTLTHSGNTIFDVTLAENGNPPNVIVRLRGTDKDTLSHTASNIHALSQLGLPVPRVLAVDTSLTRYPFRYIILEKMPGRDLFYELEAMTRPQITRLAERIVAIQQAVATLPQGTGFGWGNIGEGGEESAWFDVIRSDAERRPPTSDGTPQNNIRLRLHQQRTRFQSYFSRIAPVCFLEDLTTKNVLLQNGEFQGVIDFDCVCFGDPIWMIGLAAGCITNDIGAHALFYIEELCRCWNLTEEQRLIVAYYAAQRAFEFLEGDLTENDERRAERLIVSIEHWLTILEK